MIIQHPQAGYDIVVIGAGMVGASFALDLHKKLCGRPLSILIVEAAQPDVTGRSASPSFDDRSTALSFGTSKILEESGIWPGLGAEVTAIKNIHVSDRGHFGSTRLSSEDQQVDALGYVVENRCLGRVLNQALIDNDAIKFFCPARIETIKPVSDGMLLQVKADSNEQFEVHAGLVVLADGGRSPICQQLGITIDREKYQQQAIISNIAFEKPHGNVAYERFTGNGPLAVLPLAELDGQNRGALVWTVNEEDANLIMGLTDSQALSELQERFGYRLGRITRMGKRACYPLSLAVAREQVRPGLVLLGNVAHTLHPVAGQGFNLALRDAETLATTLANASSLGIHVGSMKVLQEFLQHQTGDQQRTISFSHYMTRLFSSERSAAVWARKFGLASIDLLPVVKRSFARAAMGLSDG